MVIIFQSVSCNYHLTIANSLHGEEVIGYKYNFIQLKLTNFFFTMALTTKQKKKKSRKIKFKKKQRN